MDYTGLYREVLHGKTLTLQRHPERERFWIVTVSNGETGIWTSGDVQRFIDSYLIVREEV